MLCGSPMPEGMKENDRFPEPIITPSTKAEVGHDEDISRERENLRNIGSVALPARKVSDLSPLTRRPCWHLKRDLSVLMDGAVPLCKECVRGEIVLGNAFDSADARGQGEPLTGRQHQIRAHLHHAGLHLVGDKIYGPDEMIFDRFTRKEMSDADRAILRLPRQALHAWRLAFPRPRDGDRVEVLAPVPDDLAAAIEVMARSVP